MKTYIIAAMTADGCIARHDNQSSLDWTSAEDKAMYRQATKAAGVMVMGSRTFATIGRSLPGRKTVVYTSRPEALQGIEAVEATTEAPIDLLRRLESEGFQEVAICGGASVYHQFLAAGVVDELHLTIEPLVFGKGVRLFDAAVDAKLRLQDVRHLSEDTLQLIYSVDR